MFTKRRRRQLRQYYGYILGAIVLNLIFPLHTTHASEISPPDSLPLEAAMHLSTPIPPDNLANNPDGRLPSLPSVADKAVPVYLVKHTWNVDQPMRTTVTKTDHHGKKTIVVRASAYSSTVDQTDSDPFTTASGSRVHDGTIANNGLPFGTKVRIPSHYGDKIFVVEDRMNSRWGNQKIDIWMPNRQAAINWGVRSVVVEIL